jgi:hypothetical protein
MQNKPNIGQSEWGQMLNDAIDHAIIDNPTQDQSIAGDFGLQLAELDIVTTEGARWVHGSISELLTLSTSGTTTDSSADLLPADSVIEAVVARITTAIVTATDWKLGDATVSGRFAAANSTRTLGTTEVGTVHIGQSGTSGPRQVSAAKLRVTTTGTPSAGVIRLTVFYSQFIASPV